MLWSGDAARTCEVRAVIAAAVNNFAHGVSGVRACVVDGCLRCCAPTAFPKSPPKDRSLSRAHGAHRTGAAGEGFVQLHGSRMSAGRDAAQLRISA